jgi:hypothetical protein
VRCSRLVREVSSGGRKVPHARNRSRMWLG